MADSRTTIGFLLNDDPVELDDVCATDMLLDHLRLEQRLCGTKEGCAEGDCGACTVLVGQVRGDGLSYAPVNACIRFLATVDCCHVVTIEHLRLTTGALHPVQQAMVDEHASQCGFCTPGIVMSLYALWLNNANPSDREIEIALQGNLCRCTGYEPIMRAARSAARIGGQAGDPLVVGATSTASKLNAMADGTRLTCGPQDNRCLMPADADDLAALRQEYPQSTIVAGATDVGLWVNKDMRQIAPAIFVSHLEELCEIRESDDHLIVGACVTYSQMQDVIARRLPQLTDFWSRIGGEQVRNMGTVGGNVANGSPIGDTPPVLIALGARVILRNGMHRRELPVEDFFIDYGKQDREEGDFVEALHIPLPHDDAKFAAYKVSKRRDEDISSVAAAFQVRIESGNVSSAIAAYGGMAATPKRAASVEAQLVGRPWSRETITSAQEGIDADFSPISDWRASAAYRVRVAQNLLERFYLETAEGHETVRLTQDASPVVSP